MRSAIAWWLVSLACRLDRNIPADLTNMVLKHLGGEQEKG